MLGKARILEIDAILADMKPEKLSKLHLRKLQNIKVKETGIRDNECFCNPAKRVKWFENFKTWYEENA